MVNLPISFFTVNQRYRQATHYYQETSGGKWCHTLTALESVFTDTFHWAWCCVMAHV